MAILPSAGIKTPTGDINIKAVLDNPTILNRQLARSLDGKFVSNQIFRTGTSNSDTVLYWPETDDPSEPARGGAAEIAPGAEYPISQNPERDPETARVHKYGTAFDIPDEAAQSPRGRDLLQDGMTRLRNAILSKTDTAALALFRNTSLPFPVPVAPSSGTWNTTDLTALTDIVTAAAHIRSYKTLGYLPDTVVLHPDVATLLTLNEKIGDRLPRENQTQNPLLASSFSGLAGIPNWIVTPFQERTEVIVLASGQAGAILDRNPLAVAPVRQELRDRTVVKGSRRPIIFLDRPLAALRITGVVDA